MKVSSLIGSIILIGVLGLMFLGGMAISKMAPAATIDEKGWECTRKIQPNNLCIQKTRTIEKIKVTTHGENR